MSLEGVDYLKAEMINDISMNNTLFPIDLDSLSFYDDREDACTQTYAAQSLYAPELPSLDITCPQYKEADLSYCDTLQLCSPTAQRRPSLCWKDKAPKTLKMLKEKHRENERLRHHSLNQHLRLICRKVPGSAENGKETKVVMMQRIISYVAYLENTIKFMCGQLGVKTNPAWLKLTSSIKDMDKSETWKKEFLAVHSEDSKDSAVISKNISHRLKLSSPTVDTTTSFSSPRPGCSQQKSENSCQDPEGTSSTACSKNVDETSLSGWQWLEPVEEVVIHETENFDDVLSSSDYDHNMFELPSSTFDSRLLESTDEVKWLGSPEKSPTHPQGGCDSAFGIRCDNQYFVEQPSEWAHRITVSPDQVIPLAAAKEEAGSDHEALASASTYLAKENKAELTRHRQSHSRSPLLSSWMEAPQDYSQELAGSHDWCFTKQDHLGSEAVESSFPEGDTSGPASLGTEATSGISKAKTEPRLEPEYNRITRDALGGDTPAKLDLRKSSWMNGFMMYSHIHRKQLIREHPGLHVSAISKMLGHAWRGMTSEQQNPYREQAQICSQELHRILKATCH